MYFGAFFIAPLEIVLVLLIIFIIFTPGRLGRVGRSLGEMISGFRQASKIDDNSNSKKTEKRRL